MGVVLLCPGGGQQEEEQEVEGRRHSLDGSTQLSSSLD
jgi:hypothetical protein